MFQQQKSMVVDVVVVSSNTTGTGIYAILIIYIYSSTM